jgi:polyhydroxybutyrate depolymerase
MQKYLEITGVTGQAGNARQYGVHVPPGYDPAKPMPVVFCIHGLGQEAVMFCRDGAGLLEKADAAGFIVVLPNGYQNSWNAGTCCGGAVSSMLDDVALMRAIFQEVSKHLNIDLSRVYATGLSNGAYMSYRLACEAADLFAAVAPGAGAIGMNDIGGGTTGTGDFAACKPAAKVSVLDLHGSADGLIPYSLQKPSMERIAMQNGCMLTTHPATQPASAGDTMCVSHDGCPAGIDVTGCTVMGGGHVWFGSPNCGTGADGACSIVGANSTTLVNTDAVWAFFEAHPRP